MKVIARWRKGGDAPAAEGDHYFLRNVLADESEQSRRSCRSIILYGDLVEVFTLSSGVFSHQKLNHESYHIKMGVRIFMFRIVSRKQFENIVNAVRSSNSRVRDAIQISKLYPGNVVPSDDIIRHDHPDLIPSLARMSPSVEYWACMDYILTLDEIFANSQQIYVTFSISSTCDEYYDSFEMFGRNFFGVDKPKWYGNGEPYRTMNIPGPKGIDNLNALLTYDRLTDGLDALPTYDELTRWAEDSFENPEYVQPPAPIEPREIRVRRERKVVQEKRSKASTIANEEKKKKHELEHTPASSHSAAEISTDMSAISSASTSAPSARVPHRRVPRRRVSRIHYAPTPISASRAAPSSAPADH